MPELLSRRSALRLLGALTLGPVLPALASAMTTLSGKTMGTRYRVIFGTDTSAVDITELRGEINLILETTESCMSLHRASSELQQFNHSQQSEWQGISADTERVVAAALRISADSDGAFNPATAPLVNHWGFGAELKILPDASAALDKPMMESVHNAGIELRPGQIRKRNLNAALDLNAIAKGDAIDQVASALIQQGIEHYLIEIGGEVYACGSAADGRPWRIGLEHPDGGIYRLISLTNEAVATSGDYIDYYFQRGRRYSHLIDPRSGQPVSSGLAAVSVIAPTAIDADAWATALMVMGPSKGPEFAKDMAMPVAFLKRVKGGYLHEVTARFEDRLANRNPGQT